jgi:hypothetical protein
VDVVEWFEILGFEDEISVKEVRERKMLGEDGVHLDRRWNIDPQPLNIYTPA